MPRPAANTRRVLSRGAPFTWRGQAMEAVQSAGGDLTAGIVWLIRTGDATPIATVRRGELTPTGREPIDDPASLFAAYKATT